MGLRIEAAGLGTRQRFELRATQEQLGEATGLTSVHVNRTLQEIRGQGLLTFDRGHVGIADWNAIARTAEFDAGYLMLSGAAAQPASRR